MRRSMSRPKYSVLIALLVVGAGPIVTSEQTAPQFDVASIKPSAPDARTAGFAIQPGGRIVMTNQAVQSLLSFAYPSDIPDPVGAPAWVLSDAYDVTAVAGSAATRDELSAMMRALLADRFKLQAHYETRNTPIYELVLAREDGQLGPDLRRSTLECGAAPAQSADQPRPTASNGAPCGLAASAGVMRSGGTTMAVLARSINRRAGRVIVDRTGLTGLYEFTLRSSGRPPGAPAAPDDPPSIFTALQEQLGLRLRPAEAPLRVLVIDRIERPTPN